MTYEFSWCDDDNSHQVFKTSCPDIAEMMMRSSSGFPRISLSIRTQFQSLFGAKHGSFAETIRSHSKNTGRLELGISGLRVVVTDKQHLM